MLPQTKSVNKELVPTRLPPLPSNRSSFRKFATSSEYPVSLTEPKSDHGLQSTSFRTRKRTNNDWIFQRRAFGRFETSRLPWSTVRQPPPQHRIDGGTQRLLQSRRQREQFRRKLVDLVLGNEDETETTTGQDSSGDYLTASEKKKLRYYYYIHNGINIEYVAPLDASWLDNMLSLVPKHLKVGWPSVADNLCQEIKTDYLFCVKKAISNSSSINVSDDFWVFEIDFVLSDCRGQIGNFDDYEESGSVLFAQPLSRPTRSTKRHLIKHLHVTNSCFQQIQYIWCAQYENFVMIDTQVFMTASSALELPIFMQIISHQIDKARSKLSNEWLVAIQNILQQGLKRNLLAAAIKANQLESYLEATATQMCGYLQRMCLKSVEELGKFLCANEVNIGLQHPGFVLKLILEENSIRFDPSIAEFEIAFLSIYDAVVATGSSVSRVDQRVFPDLQSAKCASNLKPIIPEEIVTAAKVRVSEMINRESVGPMEHANLYEKYNFIINQQISSDVNQFLTEEHNFQDYANQVKRYNELGLEISTSIVQTSRLGLFEVRCNSLIQDILQRTELAKERLLTRMTKDQQTLGQNLCSEYETIGEKAASLPMDTGQLMELKNYINEVEGVHIVRLENILSDICDRITFLIEHVNFSPAEMRLNNQSFFWYSRLPDIIKQSKQTILEKQLEFEEALKVNRHNFLEELEDYAQQAEEYSMLGDMKEMASYLSKAEELNSKLEACEEKIQHFNSEEVAFNWHLTEYPQRKQILDKLSPYLKLYETAVKFEQKYKEWSISQLTIINPDAVEQQIGEFWKSIFKLERMFTDIPLIKSMAQKVKTKVEELKEHIPLVQALCNPGLRDRHWEQIGEVVGFPLKADQETTLAKVIELNLDDYVGRFEAISEAASKEHNLEKSLQKMIYEWETMEFCMIVYRETGTYVLSSIDDIQQLLDDHIVKTQAIKSSPFVKPFEIEILKWESKLARLQEIIDAWLKVQTTWMYLEPIFTSPDIMSQMPEEGRRFNTVDKHWRDVMKVAVVDKRVMSVLIIERILERLKKSNDLLVLIQKGLNDYLEKKRLCFPRFFFLSNDELLEILAETKDPTRVQPHLRKCFEGISRLQFEDEMEVTHIISSEDEKVELSRHINTMKARGQVELWLSELEHSMLSSVRKVM